jgi:hypothetical protein
MGAVIVKRGAVFLAPLAAVLVLLALGAGSAWAACDTWTGLPSGNWYTAGNWSSGVPTSGTPVCITMATVDIDGNGGSGGAHASSLTLTSSTLNIAGGTNSTLGSLEVTNGGSIDSTSSVVLTELCNTGCTAQGSSLTFDAGFTNQGTITSAAGTDSGSGRAIYGDVTNTGSIQVNAPLTWAGGTVDNQGMISVPNGNVLTVGCCSNSATLTNDTGGQITNNGGSGYVAVSFKATFNQGAGTISPSSANPAHPAVIMDNSGFVSPAPVLHVTGTGAGAFGTRGTVTLNAPSGIGANQSLSTTGVAGCAGPTQVTSASGFTNAGTITLGGSCGAGLILTTGTLNNTGTLTAAATGGSNEINGSLTNSGTFSVNRDVAFDKSGASLSQTGGTTTIASRRILDTSNSGATFQLQGGVLSGGGQSQSTEAVINGPVSNTGANIIPGSATTPGLLGVGNYTQGAGGKLTIVVNGAGGPSGVGTHYSQLASGGNVTLGGTLAISTLATPAVNDLDTIVGGNGSRSGQFSNITGLFKPGSTFGYKPLYGSKYAALEVGAALQVKKSGPGTGTVTSSPSGINCGSQCDTPFFQDQMVTLTAHPGSGSGFAGWAGACTGSKTTCQVTMTQARTVTAKFLPGTTTSLSSSLNPAKKGRKVTYTATVSPHPSGGTVRFTSGGSTISGCGAVAVNTSTGKATCSVTYHSTGSRKIQATFSGTSTLARSVSSTLTERVTS